MTQHDTNQGGLEAFETPKGISRRTVAKAAAWSVPVLALAVAAPAASASGPAWDVTVSKTCTGQFNATGVTGVILTTLLTVLLKSEATREFTITATEGTVPIGTQFTLTNTGLVNVSLIGVTGFLGVGALNIVNIGGVATITLLQALPVGQSFTLNLLPALLDLKVAGVQSLSLVGNDNPSGVDGADSATITTLLGTSVNVLGLVDIDLQLCS